jgi:hypothetical protein
MSEISQYVKEGTYDLDLLGSYQITIPYNMELNIEGQALYDKCTVRYESGDYKDTITDWYPLFGNSGRNKHGETTIENHIITGTGSNGTLSTSNIVIMDRSMEPKWAYTISGSLYALGPRPC